jgi:hypothetical protein
MGGGVGLIGWIGRIGRIGDENLSLFVWPFQVCQPGVGRRQKPCSGSGGPIFFSGFETQKVPLKNLLKDKKYNAIRSNKVKYPR